MAPKKDSAHHYGYGWYNEKQLEDYYNKIIGNFFNIVSIKVWITCDSSSTSSSIACEVDFYFHGRIISSFLIACSSYEVFPQNHQVSAHLNETLSLSQTSGDIFCRRDLCSFIFFCSPGLFLISLNETYIGEFFQGGFFFLEVVTFFVTLRADLEDYFKCKT